jgi:multidrug efflux system membrane fusion protein
MSESDQTGHRQRFLLTRGNQPEPFHANLKEGVAIAGYASSLSVMHRISALTTSAAVLIFLSGCQKGEAPQKVQASGPPVVPVTVAEAVSRTIPVEVHAIGNVEAYSVISVKSQVAGILQHVLFHDGDMVKKGQLLFEIDPRPFVAKLDQSKAALTKDQALAADAEADAERYGALFKEGIVARQDNDAKQAAAKQAIAALDADRAQIEYDALQLQYTKIYSPVDGRAGAVAIDEGNIVKDHDVPMVTINQIQPIYVTFSVTEQDFQKIRPRMAGGLPVEALATGDTHPPVRGRLVFADNTVDVTTGTIKLRAEFANPDHRLWPGQFVNVKLTVGSEAGAILVPSQAVQSGQNGEFVFVVQPDGKAAMRPVKISRPVGSEIALASGVQVGERVITDGQSRLVPGATVQIVGGGS